MKNLYLKVIGMALTFGVTTNHLFSTDHLTSEFDLDQQDLQNSVQFSKSARISLSNQNIDDEYLNGLGQYFFPANMTTLDLSNNKITNKGAKFLCEFLNFKDYPYLSTLILSNNEISKPGEWISSLRNTTIDTIELCHLLDRLSREDACNLGKSFKGTPVQTIWLGGNYLWIDTINAILENLTETNVKTVNVYGDIAKRDQFRLILKFSLVTNSKDEKIEVKFMSMPNQAKPKIISKL